MHNEATILSPEKERKLIEIFITVDDFCLQLDGWKQNQPERFPVRAWDNPRLSESELISICVFYHYSG